MSCSLFIANEVGFLRKWDRQGQGGVGSDRVSGARVEKSLAIFASATARARRQIGLGCSMDRLTALIVPSILDLSADTSFRVDQSLLGQRQSDEAS